MGAGNVKLAYARWYGLPDLPFRLLAYMAVVSMDEDTPPSFWGGWEALALAAGRLVPPASDDKEVIKVRRAALKAATVALKVLIERGAIGIKSAAAPGRNTTYVLNLTNGTVHGERAPSQDIDQLNGARLPDTTVHGYPTNGARLPDQTVHAHRAPEEYKEQEGLNLRNEEAAVDLNVTGPRANERSEESDPSAAMSAPLLRLVSDTTPRIAGRRWSTRGTDAIAEATARRAARLAAHKTAEGAS